MRTDAEEREGGRRETRCEQTRNIDAVKAAGGMGIAANRAANYHADAMGTATNFAAVNMAFTAARTCGAVADDWKKDIDKDYQERKK